MSDRREFIRDILKAMFNGHKLYEESWNSETNKYDRSDYECMIEACNGDQIECQLLKLFDHWWNDIESLAAHYGIEVVDGKLVDDVPPAPSINHWRDGGVWREPSINDYAVAKQEIM